jgi:transcriptional regulator with XRE-family HTH domain
MMNEIRRLREAAGASQIRIANLAGVARMRLSLAETGDVEFDVNEMASVKKAIAKFATAGAAELGKGREGSHRRLSSTMNTPLPR